MRSAIEIANWMICNGGKYGISNLKIQKLLYIAFGTHFAECDEHLFYDPIEAWKYGPVVQSVYHHLKSWGSEVITSPIVLQDGSIPMLKDDERQVIDSINETLELFGHKSGYDLMQWSHTENGPWDLTYDKDRPIKEIDKLLIRRAILEQAGWPVPTRLKAI